MFGFRKKNRVKTVVQLIAASGEMTAQLFEHAECHNFPHGDRWIAYCGTIPAFAYVIIYETLIKSGLRIPTPEQRAEQCSFFQSVEDGLYALYERNRGGDIVSLRRCLLLQSELSEVCTAFGCNPDVHTTPDMILGIILPNRLSKYQEDWKYPILRLAEGQRDLDMSCYVAMRLAADLTGIVTPESLVGHVAADLGIEKYGMAYLALTSFATSYMNVSSGE